MDLKLVMNDGSYDELLNGRKVIRGSITLTNHNEVYFRPDRPPRHDLCQKFASLAHGRIAIYKDDIRLRLRIPLNETGINPQQSINNEAWKALSFLDEHLNQDEK